MYQRSLPKMCLPDVLNLFCMKIVGHAVRSGTLPSWEENLSSDIIQMQCNLQSTINHNRLQTHPNTDAHDVTNSYQMKELKYRGALPEKMRYLVPQKQNNGIAHEIKSPRCNLSTVPPRGPVILNSYHC